MATHHIKVTGKVQGVFYRATAKRMAEAAGLRGWVRNTANEEVEMLVTGEEDRLHDFEAWCRHGPPRAEVTDVSVAVVDEVDFDDFKILK